MNKDQKVIEDFGEEWTDFKYESNSIVHTELEKKFSSILFHFPMEKHS